MCGEGGAKRRVGGVFGKRRFPQFGTIAAVRGAASIVSRFERKLVMGPHVKVASSLFVMLAYNSGVQ
jgi:hypothetical protein